MSRLDFLRTFTANGTLEWLISNTGFRRYEDGYSIHCTKRNGCRNCSAYYICHQTASHIERSYPEDFAIIKSEFPELFI